jgi:hypothetical protein
MPLRTGLASEARQSFYSGEPCFSSFQAGPTPLPVLHPSTYTHGYLDCCKVLMVLAALPSIHTVCHRHVTACQCS